MKITVEFLSLPNVAKMVGARTITMDFSGRTVDDLIHQVADRYGARVRQFLLDETGQLDPTLKVTVNKQDWIPRDQMDRPLGDGDNVTILMLVSGG